jgi:hypothetical protein
MSIQYSSITQPGAWLEVIAQQFGAPVIDDQIKLPRKLGEGFFRQYYPFEWLTVSYLRFKVHQPMNVERKGVQNRPLIPIVFYLDEGEQFVNDKGLPVMNNASMSPINPNGITERTIKQDLKLLNSRIKAATKANRVNRRIAPNPENDRC